MQVFVGLGEVADLQAGPQAHFPRQGRYLRQDGLEESGFPGTVGANQGGGLQAVQLDILSRKQTLPG